MEQTSGSVRSVVRYTGHVQGVGFRYTTRQVAAGFAVTGYVRNLSDGRVELVAEGAAAELDRFLDAVQQRLGDHITGHQRDRLAASGEFSQFEIRV